MLSYVRMLSALQPEPPAHIAGPCRLAVILFGYHDPKRITLSSDVRFGFSPTRHDSWDGGRARNPLVSCEGGT